MPRLVAVRRIRSIGLTALCLAASAASARSQVTARDTVYLDSVLHANRYAIAVEHGALTSAGARLLTDAARRAQFFMLAESHYVAETPQFASALFDALHRTAGYDFYAVEFGPVIMHMLSVPGVRGSDERTLDLARRYPHAFQFWDDEELDAFARIGRMSNSRTAPLWGLDNEWGALHVLDQLVAVAPNRSARDTANQLAQQARSLERARPFSLGDVGKRFITSPDTAMFDGLRDAFGRAPSTNVQWLLDALETSNRIYVHNIAAEHGALTGYASNSERETLMKTQFMANYRRARIAGDSLPRVLLKFGTVHGALGLTPSAVTSLGTFVHELAIANGMESFHLAAWLVNKPGRYWSLSESAGYEALARQGSTESWTIVDLRPLRPLLHAGRLAAVTPQLRTTITGYDAVLLIGSGRRGSYERLQHER
jgi:hypothetical protein